MPDKCFVSRNYQDFSTRPGQVLLKIALIIDLACKTEGILLSILLKPFLNKSKRINDNPELHPDTELSLSLIESGCMFARMNDKTALIIKSTGHEIDIMKEFQAITVDFELFERPEFPSLAFSLNMDTKRKRTFRFEYFFNTESEEEMSILGKMCGEKRFDILFYNSSVKFIIRTEISEEQASELGSLLNRARV